MGFLKKSAHVSSANRAVICKNIANLSDLDVVKVNLIQIRSLDPANDDTPGLDIDAPDPHAGRNHRPFTHYIYSFAVERYCAGWPQIRKTLPVSAPKCFQFQIDRHV